MVTRALARNKKADDEKATILWVDEAGFYLLPMAVRTWAPRGQTPILRVSFTHDHLSAISGITLDGRLFMQVRPASYDAEAVVGFLPDDDTEHIFSGKRFQRRNRCVAQKTERSSMPMSTVATTFCVKVDPMHLQRE